MPHTVRLRLTPELVPAPLWGRSAYRLLGRGAHWKAIRRDTLQAASHRCSICGSDKGQLSCHEKWRYNERRATATLIGFEIHCSDCDAVTHAGRATALGLGDVVVRQLCKLNGCTAPQAKRMIEAAIVVWEKRSAKLWKVVVAAPLLKAYPQLQVLQAYNQPPVG